MWLAMNCRRYQGHHFIKPECTEFAFIIAVVVVLTYISTCVISAEECQTDTAGG